MTDVEDLGFDPDDLDPNEKRSLRGRGLLASDVNRICRMFIAGELQLEDGKYLTPYMTARCIKEVDSLEEAPSQGAVAACFDRWQEYGYATFRRNPYAFLDFTEEGLELGLEGIIEKRRKDRKTITVAKDTGQS